MWHRYKYLLALTGVVSLFLILCPTYASAQKKIKYSNIEKKLSSATLKFKLPEFPRYVPPVSFSPLSPTSSGTLLEISARQVIKFDPQSVILLFPSKESIPAYLNGRSAIEQNIINQFHQQAIPTNSKVDNTLHEIVPESPPKEVNEGHSDPYYYEMLEQMKQFSPIINLDINRCCIFIYAYVEGVSFDVIDEEVGQLLS